MDRHDPAGLAMTWRGNPETSPACVVGSTVAVDGGSAWSRVNRSATVPVGG